MPQTTCYNWSSVPGTDAAGAVQQIIKGAEASLRMVTIKAGTTAARHSHDHEQFVCILQGSGTLECEPGPFRLQQGTVIRFEPNAWHSAVFDTDTVLMEVNLKTPG